MPVKSILVVQEDLALRDALKFALEIAGLRVVIVDCIEKIAQAYKQNDIDLVLLDWMFKQANGFTLAKYIRTFQRKNSAPIVLLVPQNIAVDFNGHANEFVDGIIEKPFSAKGFVARLNGFFHRSDAVRVSGCIKVEDLQLFPSTRELIIDRKAVSIGPTEYRLLEFFLLHPERVLSRSHLLDCVWYNSFGCGERTVDAYVRRIRGLLEGSGYEKFIQTVRGEGYRFSTKI